MQQSVKFKNSFGKTFKVQAGDLVFSTEFKCEYGIFKEVRDLGFSLGEGRLALYCDWYKTKTGEKTSSDSWIDSYTIKKIVRLPN